LLIPLGTSLTSPSGEEPDVKSLLIDIVITGNEIIDQNLILSFESKAHSSLITPSGVETDVNFGFSFF